MQGRWPCVISRIGIAIRLTGIRVGARWQTGLEGNDGDHSHRAETRYWSKAVGEPPLVLAISVHQAPIEAIRASGVPRPALDAPATPERVLLARSQLQE